MSQIRLILMMLILLIPSIPISCDYGDVDAEEDRGYRSQNGLVTGVCREKIPTWGESIELTVRRDAYNPQYVISREYCWFRNFFKSHSPCGTSWGDYHEITFDQDPASKDGSMSSLISLAARKWCIKKYEKGEEMPAGQGTKVGDDNNEKYFNTSPIPKICAFQLWPWEGCDNNKTLVGCIDKPIVPGPVVFNKVLPSTISVVVGTDPDISTFDQPVIVLTAEGGLNNLSGEKPLRLRYIFPGDESSDNLKDCGSFQKIPELSGRQYCAFIDPNAPWEVCACEGTKTNDCRASADGKKGVTGQLGCVPRPTPSNSKPRLAIIAETSPSTTPDRPAMEIMFVRTDGNGYLRTLTPDGKEGKLLEIDSNGSRSWVEDGGKTTPIRDTEEVIYNKLTLPLPSPDLPLKEFYLSQVQDEKGNTILDKKTFRPVLVMKRGQTEVYGIKFSTIIPKFDPRMTNKLSKIPVKKTTYQTPEGCTVFSSGDDNDPKYIVPGGQRDRSYCCPKDCCVAGPGSKVNKSLCIVPYFDPQSDETTVTCQPPPDGSKVYERSEAAEEAYCPGIYIGQTTPAPNPADKICLVSTLQVPAKPTDDPATTARKAAWNNLFTEGAPVVCDFIGLRRITKPEKETGYAIWEGGKTQAVECGEGYAKKMTVSVVVEDSDPNGIGEKLRNTIAVLQKTADGDGNSTPTNIAESELQKLREEYKQYKGIQINEETTLPTRTVTWGAAGKQPDEMTITITDSCVRKPTE